MGGKSLKRVGFFRETSKRSYLGGGISVRTSQYVLFLFIQPGRIVTYPHRPAIAGSSRIQLAFVRRLAGPLSVVCHLGKVHESDGVGFAVSAAGKPGEYFRETIIPCR